MLSVTFMVFSASPSLADPRGASVFVAATSWLQETVLGTVATTIAVIAVATVGLMALTGRVSIRHGLTVVVGCFILFGAPAIVAGLQSFVGGGQRGAGAQFYRTEPAPSAMAPLPPLPPPGPYDPYAGASVPGR